MLRSFSFLQSSFFLIFFGNLSILLDAIYRIYISRNLTSADFGMYSVLISLLSIFDILNASFVWWSNKKYAFLYSQKKKKISFLKKNYLYLFLLNLPMLTLLILSRESLNSIYQIEDRRVLNFLILSYIINVPVLPLISLTKGLHRFGISSFMAFAYNFIRLGFLFLFIVLQFSLVKVFLSLIVTNILFLVTYFLVIMIILKPFLFFQNFFSDKLILEDWKNDLKEYSKILIFLVFIVLVMSIDIILVKIKFSSLEVGRYAVASMWAKLVIAITNPLLDLVFPIFLNNKNKVSVNSKLFLVYLLVFGIVVAFLVNILFYFTKEEIHANKYNDIGLLVNVFTISALPLILLQCLAFYSFNKEKVNLKVYLKLLLLIVVNISLILLLTNSLYHVIFINGISYILMLFVLWRNVFNGY